RRRSHLGADRAVAFAGAGADIEIRFEANGAAVAASGVCLEHRILRQFSVFRHCTMTGTVTAQSRPRSAPAGMKAGGNRVWSPWTTQAKRPDRGVSSFRNPAIL